MRTPPQPFLQIRDPIHRAIEVDSSERAIVDHSFVQRLRGIRQLGFSAIPFPGATHSRFLHSIGAMELAGRAFDSIFRDNPFSHPSVRWRLRRAVRLAALCHDLGHGPFSHAAEFAMPKMAALGIGVYSQKKMDELRNVQASHEDYTVAILTGSTMAQAVADNFQFTGRHVAALISPDVYVEDDFFFDSGFDLRPILSQLISSNLDVDRMDYLVRDTYFTGTSYGHIDVGWLITNMLRHVDDNNRVSLGLDRQALYALDDFMIARLHMFLMVYFHHKSVAMELLLKRSLRHPSCTYVLPSDIESYQGCDDAHMQNYLRSASDPWSKRLVSLETYRVALEIHGQAGKVDLTLRRQVLEDEGIDVMEDHSVGVIYRAPPPGKPPIAIVDTKEGGRAMPLSAIGGSLKTHASQVSISRLFVPREEQATAKSILDKLGDRFTQQLMML